MKFFLIMIWLGMPGQPIILGPFETEKLCVQAAGMLFSKWKQRISGDFLCIPSEYEKDEK